MTTEMKLFNFRKIIYMFVLWGENRWRSRSLTACTCEEEVPPAPVVAGGMTLTIV